MLIPYGVFGALAFLAAIACHFLPETANQPTLETIDGDTKIPKGSTTEGIDNVVIKSSLEEEEVTSKL